MSVGRYTDIARCSGSTWPFRERYSIVEGIVITPIHMSLNLMCVVILVNISMEIINMLSLPW